MLVNARRKRLVILQTVKLTRMKMPGGGGSLDDHLDNRRREPHDVLHRRGKIGVELCHQLTPSGVALGLSRGIQCGELVLEQLEHSLIAVLCRSHRFDNVAGIAWMVIAVVRDELSASVVRGEEAVRIRRDVEPAVAISLGPMRTKELPLVIELEGVWRFLLAGDVRRRARRHEYRSRRERDQGLLPFL